MVKGPVYLVANFVAIPWAAIEYAISVQYFVTDGVLYGAALRVVLLGLTSLS